MFNFANASHNNRTAMIAITASILTILVGLSGVIGWEFNITLLKGIAYNWEIIKVDTTYCFILSGLSLFLFSCSFNRAAKIIALFVFIFCCLTLVEECFNVNLFINHIYFYGLKNNNLPLNLVLMPPLIAVNFLLISLALLCSNKYINLTQVFALLIFVMPLLTFLDFIYELVKAEELNMYIRMSLNAAIGFVFCSIGILANQPAYGIGKLFASRNLGGILIRRLVPAAILLPIILGSLRLLGQKIGLFQTDLGVSLAVLGTVIINVLIIWYTSSVLDNVDKNREKIEKELRENQEHLKIVNSELEAFCYSVSHDLRAPLRAIDGFSLAIEEDYANKLDDKAKNYLQRIRSGAKRMAQLIDDLLDLSRVTRADVQSELINLSEIAKDTMQDIQQRDPSRKVNWQIGQDVFAYGDKSLIKIVFENLFNNSWKFTKNNSNALIEFGIKKNPDHTICYYIRDNGAGFDMNYVNKLFNAFQRLHTNEEFPGTGIGLATVQRIINRHHGKIWAEGAVNRGATFYFNLDK